MSFFSKIFGGGEGSVKQPCLDTHRLFRVPVSISFEIVVAAPSENEASQREIIDAYLKDILSDLKNRMEDVPELAKNVSLGAARLIRGVDEVPEEYQSALPYEHPLHPTGADVECRYWFRGK